MRRQLELANARLLSLERERRRLKDTIASLTASLKKRAARASRETSEQA
jgi:hypothetical protein